MTLRLVFVGFIVSLMWLMMAFVCHAGPFLVCEPQTGVDAYELEINGAIVASDIPAEADGSIRYDLVGTVNGSYNLRLRCSNLWGMSEWSQPLAVVVQVCGEPQTLRLVP